MCYNYASKIKGGMFMANDYTDKFEGEPYFIKKGEPLSAAGMTAALNTKEKLANKKDTISNSSTEYPSSKAVYDGLNAQDNGTLHKAGAETVTGVKTFGTADAAAEPLLGMAKTTDATNNGIKFASEAQVYKKQDKLTVAQLGLLASLSTLGFFPKGTILPFSAAAWDEASSDFKTIWKICDDKDGRTPNLAGKFLRGGAYADYGVTGGTNTAQVPYHNHTFSGNIESGYLPIHWNEGAGGVTVSSTGVFAKSSRQEQVNGWSVWGNLHGTAFSLTPKGTVGYAGSQTTPAENRPEFYTVIYIMKVV
jgi:hypothetical protein